MSRKPLTLDAIQARVNAILTIGYDPERSHTMEDALHRDTLKTIARGVSAEEAQALAAAALKTIRIDFPRWRA
jgi:hypothetical protein